ncbi:MAG: NAD(P)-dependent oxidoreductase [Parvibaculum sp.]|uniref:NAD(P)-dependent oxidoreductase n=1 Tax=Parvibaculum sp. TaxID=2024848 RepID=UPI0032EAA4B0
MTVRWITPLLGTVAATKMDDISGATIIDVRDFVDRAGNPPEAIRPKIMAGVQALREGRKTIICCDHGISRSNAFAAGILAVSDEISLGEAVRRVVEATGESEMRPDVVAAVQLALATPASERPRSEKKERWLLTGANGSLGGLIRRTAPTDVELVAPDRNELDLLSGSVFLSLFAEANEITRILHFASPRIGNTNRAMGQAVTMLRTALETAGNLNVPILVPSRWEVFAGYTGETLSVTEEKQTRPHGILGETKFLCESLALEWAAQGRAAVTILRSGLVFGDGIAPHFIRTFIRKSHSGEPVLTHVYENGSPELDLIASVDWVSAFWGLAKSDLTGLFQAGGDALFSTRQIAEITLLGAGRGCQTEELPVQGKIANIRLDFAKLRQTTGWSPSQPTAEALTRFLQTLPQDRAQSLQKGRQ